MNRTIWMLWLQGWDNAPPVAAACRESFAAMNPTWTIRSLDSRSYVDYLGPEAGWITERAECIPPAALSDLIRIELLRNAGGVWADATVLCLRPLDEWLPLVASDTLFAFRDPGPDRRLSSWFLSAPGGDPLVAAWADTCRQYWERNDSPDEYHWFHYEFAALLESSPRLHEIWDMAPYLAAARPQHLLPHHRKLNAAPTADDLAVFTGSTTPVLKLTHKFEPDPHAVSNYTTVTGSDDRLAMHYPPGPTPGDLDGMSLHIVTSPQPSDFEALRVQAIEHYLTSRGASVAIDTNLSEPTPTPPPVVVVDARHEFASEVPATACPVVAFNAGWNAQIGITDHPVFVFDVPHSYLGYVDPAMLAPLPAIHWSSPIDAIAVIGFENDLRRLDILRDICHRLGYATEQIGRAVTTRTDLSAFACGIASSPDERLVAARHGLPCLVPGDGDEVSAAEIQAFVGRAAALSTIEREQYRRRWTRDAEITLASLSSVISRLARCAAPNP